MSFKSSFLNKIVFNILRLNKNSVISQYDEIKRVSKLNETELETIKEKKLSAILAYATENTEYYNAVRKNKGQTPSLSDFPILTKKDLVKNQEGLISKNFNRNKLVKLSSSGSSGLRSDCYLSKNEINIDRAIQMLWWEWAGVKFGNPIIQTGNNKRSSFKKAKDFLFNTVYLEAFRLDRNEVISTIKNASPGTSLCGYASSLYQISEICDDNKISTKNISASVCWGDKLFEHYKKSLQKVFGVKVHETYGCSEGLKIASQYDVEFLYIMSANIVIEVVDDEGNHLPDGEIGHILLTSLDRFAMPMIRYRIGDLGCLLEKEFYPEGRVLSLPLLKKVIGRDTDLIILPDGNKVNVHSFTAKFEYITEVAQFRVVQEQTDNCIIEIIPSKDSSLNESELVEYIWSQFHKILFCEGFNFSVSIVEDIPNTRSGKPQIILNTLDYYK